MKERIKKLEKELAELKADNEKKASPLTSFWAWCNRVEDENVILHNAVKGCIYGLFISTQDIFNIELKIIKHDLDMQLLETKQKIRMQEDIIKELKKRI